MIKLNYKKKIKDVDLRDAFSFLKLLSHSGIPLKESMEIIEKSLKRNSHFNISRLIELINEGKTMHNALMQIGIEDKFVLSVIEISEMSGQLFESFERLEQYYERKIEIKTELFKIFAYPFTVLISIFSLMFGIVMYIVPQIVTDFFEEGAIRPREINVIMGINWGIKNYSYIFFMILSIVIIFIMTLAANENTKMLLEKYIARNNPFASITQRIYMKNFAWKVHSLLKTGLDVYSSIKILKSMENNLYYRNELELMEKILSSGASLTDAAKATKICDEVAITYIDKGIEVDNMVEAFASICIIYETYIRTYVKKIKAILQPLTVMILGILVALLAMLVISITNVSNFITEVGY